VSLAISLAASLEDQLAELLGPLVAKRVATLKQQRDELQLEEEEQELLADI
jgi:hypothetical protein